MAKSLLDQVLSFAGLKTSEDEGYYHPSVYEDTNKEDNQPQAPSGVERYQQKKDAATATKKLSGVEKYLTDKQQTEDKKIKDEAASLAKLSGVEKYLAKKQQQQQQEAVAEAESLANMTGVAKYLFKLESSAKKTPPKAKEESAPVEKKAEAKKAEAKTSRVDQYIAKQASKPVVAVKEEVEVTESSAEDETPLVEEVVETQEPEVVEAVETQDSKAVDAVTEEIPEEPVATEEATSNDIINHAESAKQCQAATLKGTQCRRKNNLETIERTINQQSYQFAVCRQHNNDDFTPLATLV